jgi:hypothetical protein
MWATRREAAFASIEQADRKARWGAPLQIQVHGITVAPGSAGPGGDAAMTGGCSVHVGDQPPAEARAGDLWWCSASTAGGGQLYVYYIDPSGAPGQWTAATNQPSGSGSSGIVTVVPPVTREGEGGVVEISRDRPSVYVSSLALDTLTVRLWSSPVVGETAQICFANPVTALTVETAGSTPVAGAPTNAYGPGSAIIFRFVEPGEWRYWK